MLYVAMGEHTQQHVT